MVWRKREGTDGKSECLLNVVDSQRAGKGGERW